MPPQTIHDAPPSRKGPDAARPRGVFGLADGVKRLLGLAEDGTAIAASEDAPEPRSGVERTPSTLATVAAGRLSLLGLAEIRQELGPRWAALSEKVNAIAQAVVARHLTRGDVFERHGEDSYIVLFATLSSAEAEFKCHAIRNEIGRQLLGSEWAGLSKVEVRCAEIAKDALASGNLDAVFAAAFADEEDAPRAVFPIAAASTASEAEAASVVWAYAPVWDFRHMALIRFRLIARSPAGVRLYPFLGQSGDTPQALLFEIDLEAFEKTIGDLTGLSAHDRRLPAICPIHESSLTRASWANQFIRLALQAPAPVRRLLTVEICGPAAKLGTLSVRSFIDEIGRLGVACAGCFEAEAGPMARIDSPLTSINIEFPQPPEDESVALRIMASVAQASSRDGVQLGVYGLASRALVVGAVGAGFRFLSGDAVHAEIAVIDHAFRFDLTDLYREFQPQ